MTNLGISFYHLPHSRILHHHGSHYFRIREDMLNIKKKNEAFVRINKLKQFHIKLSSNPRCEYEVQFINETSCDIN